MLCAMERKPMPDTCCHNDLMTHVKEELACAVRYDSDPDVVSRYLQGRHR